MTEYVNKERLKQAVRNKWQDLETRVEVNCIVNSMPTIDIVDCENCKYYNKSIRLCDIGHSACAPDWFCADMRRNENNG